ncbi:MULTISPECIES: formyltransferase family protein [Lysinibacillus]|uniref:formyltransferase family protein n=1 Tax=Lysinibacillus TaxID=400634 RepID=UPI0028A03529|nr:MULTISPECIES: formyltransferase family protein [Lysinibacillus]
MSYKITILTDRGSWVNKYIDEYIEGVAFPIKKIFNYEDIREGDFLFILGYTKIIGVNYLLKNKHNLVVHASALPKGKGWSPLTWQILEGENEIPITLFEASKEVDAGMIYFQDIMKFNGTELVEELRNVLGKYTMNLCQSFIDTYPQCVQNGKMPVGEGTFYSRRTPKDSQLNIHETIKNQFNLLRVVDNEKYPAFFVYKENKYKIEISKCDE